MNIPPVNRLAQTTSNLPVNSGTAVSNTANQATSAKSTIVSLAGDAPSSGAPQGLTWENKTRSTAATLMAQNMTAKSVNDRFAGLGSEILKQVAYDGKDFSQTVQAAQGVGQADTYDMLVSSTQRTLNGAGDNKIGLSIKTVSGVKVDFSLDASDQGIAVSAQSDGKLNDNERKALAELAGAFQKAIDGISGSQPRIDLADLTQYDHFAISSIDLNAQVKLSPDQTQNLEFHANSSGRAISFNGPSGSGQVAVDLGQSASWGTKEQQAKALNNYVKQIGQAAARGHANSDMVTMFKDAFTNVHSDYGTPAAKTSESIEFSDQDRALTTGLADFSASFSQTPTSPNPARFSEKDSSSYELIQATTISGSSQDNRSISQQQHAHLKARYHAPVSDDAKLALDLRPQSQNYKYVSIDDMAFSSTNIAYNNGGISNATLEMQANQSMRTQNYSLGKLASDETTPYGKSITQDLMTTLQPERQGKSMLTDSERVQMLADLNGKILLQTNPDALPTNFIVD